MIHMENKLKVVLVDEGITQSDLQKKSGISTSTISKTANCKMVPSPTMQSRIIKAINELVNEEKYSKEYIFNNHKWKIELNNYGKNMTI